jgi:hypothetical protein
VKRVRCKSQLTVDKPIRVRERNDKLIVVVAHCRSKEQRTQSIKIQHQAGKEASSVVVQAFLSGVNRANISVVVKHCESVTMFKRANTIGSSLRIGNDMPRIVGLLLLIICGMISQLIAAATGQHLHGFTSIAPGCILTLSVIF